MTKKAKPTKIIFMGSTLEIIREDLKKIEYGSNFMYDKENELWFVLSEAFYELVFLLNRFETAQNKLFTENSSDVEYFFNSMNEFSPDQVQDKSMIVEFHAIDLSVYFKSFLVISKSVLDKLVPLYSYRFSDSLRQFDKKGVRLIKNIKKSKQSFRRTDMVTLITRAKDEWLDSLISLRDEYTHYSTLQEYRNFWFPIEKWVEQRPLNDLTTINKPTIEVNGKPIPALEYMQKIKAKLVDFLGAFLRLCEFTPDRRPKISLRCGECNHVFARMNSPKKGQLHIPNQFLEFKIKDRSRDYGVIICPECGEQTDTDLKFWPPAMFSPPI